MTLIFKDEDKRLFSITKDNPVIPRIGETVQCDQTRYAVVDVRHRYIDCQGTTSSGIVIEMVKE